MVTMEGGGSDAGSSSGDDARTDASSAVPALRFDPETLRSVAREASLELREARETAAAARAARGSGAAADSAAPPRTALRSSPAAAVVGAPPAGAAAAPAAFPSYPTNRRGPSSPPVPPLSPRTPPVRMPFGGVQVMALPGLSDIAAAAAARRRSSSPRSRSRSPAGTTAEAPPLTARSAASPPFAASTAFAAAAAEAACPPTGAALVRERAGYDKAGEGRERRRAARLRAREQEEEAQRAREALLQARQERIESSRTRCVLQKKEGSARTTVRNSQKQRDARLRAHETERAQAAWASQEAQRIDEKHAAVDVVARERAEVRSLNAKTAALEEKRAREEEAAWEAERALRTHNNYVAAHRKVEELRRVGAVAADGRAREGLRLTQREEEARGAQRARLGAASRRADSALRGKRVGAVARATSEAAEWTKRVRSQSPSSPSPSPVAARASPATPRIKKDRYAALAATRYSGPELEDIAAKMLEAQEALQPSTFQGHTSTRAGERPWKHK